MKYVSVCSGMEAASVAWHDLGFTPLAFAEIDAFPSAILAHRFPSTPNYHDLTKYKSWPIEPGSADLLVGGTPCQAFSVAGLRKGLEDPRGNLSLTFLGLVQHLRPRWVLWENVPGVLSSGKPAGSDFASFLAGLGELGYGWAYRICDAQFYGVPQRRRRVFVVATNTGDWRVAAETLSLAEGMRGYLEASEQKRKGAASRTKSRSGADGLDGTVGTLCADSHPGAYSGQDAYTGRLIPQAFGGNNTSGPIQVATALTAHGGPHGRQDFASETFIAQSKSHWDGGDIHPTINQSNKGSGSPGYSNQEIFSQQGGGLVPAPMMFKVRGGVETNNGSQGGEVGKSAGKGFLGSEDKAFTLATTNDQWLAHPIPINTMAALRPEGADQNRQTFGIGQPGDPQFTISATHCHAVGQPIPIHDQATRFSGRRGDKQDGKGNGLGIGQPGDPMNTLTRGDHHAVAIPLGGEHIVAPTVTTCKGSRGGCSSEAIDEITAIHKAQGVDLYNQTMTGDVHVPLRTAGGHGAPAVIEPVAFDTYNQSVSHISKTLSCAASDADHVGTVFHPAMAVRRLSVRECERLQGFPDDWSMIPWRGKPAEECPDGPRYKACGNSMAVPVMRHLGKAIAAMDKKLKGES
jgi:DNA (cytosine-5)-methyltransferase 1